MPYITVGYRLGQPVSQCFTQTMLILHNEAANVYSHLLPVGYWIYKLYQVVTWTGPFSVLRDTESLVCCAIGCLSLIYTLLASATFH